jgi:Fis family transcriptional regulator
MIMSNKNPLEQSVREQLERYLTDLGESEPRDMLAMVISCVERPVLQVALEQSQGNQSKAAEMLGITRSTLRKKLIAHNLQP